MMTKATEETDYNATKGYIEIKTSTRGSFSYLHNLARFRRRYADSESQHWVEETPIRQSKRLRLVTLISRT